MIKLLAIDDNKDNLTVLEAVIKDAFPDSILFTSQNGPGGIELALAKDPDVILLDIVMPELEGYEVCKILKSNPKTKNILIIMVTAIKTDAENRIKGLKIGADAFLSKPIDTAELYAQINLMLRIKSAEDKLRHEKVILEALVDERTKELSDSYEDLKIAGAIRKQAKEDLQVSELKYRNQANFLNVVIENSPFAMWISNAKGILLRANEALRNILNVTDDMIIGKYNVLNDENIDAQGFIPAVEAVFKDLKSARFTMFWEGSKAGDVDLSNANELWIDASMFPIQDDAGKLVNVVCQYVDITDRKKAEEKLKDSEERLTLVIKGSHDAPWDWDFANKNIYYSPQWWAQIGYKPDELTVTDQLWYELTHPDDRGITDAVLDKAVKSDMESYQIEFRLKHKDGHYVPILSRGFITRDSDGNMIRVTGTNMDLTERKQAELEIVRAQEKAEESEKYLDNIINNIGDPVFVKDNQSRILLANEAFCDIFGLPISAIIGKTLAEEVTPEEQESFLKIDKQVLADGIENINEETLTVRDGNTHIISTKKTRFIDNNGKKFLIGIIRDITERKHAEEIHQKSEIEYRTTVDSLLVGVVVHDSDSRILISNPEANNILGLTSEQMSGKEVTDPEWMFVYEDMSPMKIDDYPASKVIRTLNPLKNYIFGIICPDREFVTWVNVNAMPLLNTDNKLEKVIVNFIDITEHKKVEEKLKLNRLLLRKILDIVPIFICAKNLEGKFILVNKKLTAFYGSTVEAMTNVIHADLCEDENELRAMLADDREVIESGKPKFIPEETMENPDGSTIILETYKIPFEAQGKPAVLIASIDITERKQAEAELFNAEKKYRELVNLAQEGIWAIDKKNETSFVNPSMAKMLGYSPEEMLGKSLFDFMDDAGIKIANQNLERRQAGFKDQHDFEFICKDGNRIIAALETAPILDKAGNYEGALAGVINITDRKQAEKDLLESEEYFRTLIENSSDVISILDDKGFITYESPSHEKVLGYETGKLIGENVFGLVHPDDRERISRQFVKLLKRPNEIEQVNFRFLHKNGTWIYIEGTGTNLLNSSKIKGIVVNYRDITDRKQAEEMLAENDLKYRSLFDNKLNGLAYCKIVVDDNNRPVDYIFLEINRAFEEFTGLKKEVVLGKRITEIIPGF
ncbi:MAG: PAS domain S-box protein, partial [Candidatus Stygibacter australis]|nr:PAS domain S-box protein [Candidatus Stygibacter australis]